MSLAGKPLADALSSRRQRPGTPQGRVPIAATATIALGLVGGLMGLVQGKPVLLLPGVLLIGIGSLLWWRSSRHGRDELAVQADIGEDAALFDAYLDTVLPELPPEAATALRHLKDRLVDVLIHMGDGDGAGILPSEEQFFVRELISRYARDVCDSYLTVVRVGKDMGQVAGEKTPAESLLAQIDILAGRLNRILERVAAAKREQQAMHEAFIATKRQS